MRTTRIPTAATALLFTATALAVAAQATGASAAKAFPAGCWIGTKTYSGTYASGPLKANVTSGRLTLVLWVGKGATGPDRPAVGFIKHTGNGSGTFAASGSKLTLKVKIKGNYDLTGSASHVVANGGYRWVGVAVGTGQFLPAVPVNIEVPTVDAPLTIQTVSPRRVTGLFLKGTPWGATLRAGAPSKSAMACADAAKQS